MPSDTAQRRNEVALLQPSRLPWNPVFAERYGVDPASWKALVEAVFPAAKSPDSVALALSYCKARRLDPFKRVVHIVPTWDEEKGGYVETVWPGIAEHRTTAMRTGLYAGADPAEYGPTIEKTFKGNLKRGEVEARVRFPEWCQVTVYRLAGGQRVPVPGPRVYWEETFSAMGRSGVPNARWQRAPYQMIEKCAEAAALRRGFPEELGDEHTADEERHTVDTSEPEPLRAQDITPDPPRAAAITHELPPMYVVIDADCEEREYESEDDATRALVAVFDDAARRGPSHLEAARENNAEMIAKFGDPHPDSLPGTTSGNPAGRTPSSRKDDVGGRTAPLHAGESTQEPGGEINDMFGGKARKPAGYYKVRREGDTADDWAAWLTGLRVLIENPADPNAAVLRDNRDDLAIFEQIDAMAHNKLLQALEAK